MKKKLLLRSMLLLFISTSSFAQYTKIFDFVDTTSGRSPYYGAVLSDGTYLYGMNNYGGTNDFGVLFKIKTDGTGFVKLLDFAGPATGSYPGGSLISDGTFLYGMTSDGGTYDDGVIFKIKTDGSGFAKIFDFNSDTSGDAPYGSLFSDGTFLYGMTSYGGLNGDGTIFKIKPDGSSYAKLLDFSATTYGSHPYGTFITDGTFLYAMTKYGGTNGLGIIFKIKPDGSGFVNLLNFDMVTNGNTPLGSLTTDNIYLYGMTQDGGANSDGTIFKIKTDGSGYVKLLDFDGILTGSEPEGSLISDGTFLYGMTGIGGTSDDGVVFKIKTDGSNYEKLLDFVSATSGSEPGGSLIIDGNFLYGMTRLGGTNDDGVIFKYGIATGINNLSIGHNQFTLYPNPADDFLIIENSFSKNENASVIFFDVTGKEIYSSPLKTSNTKFETRNLENGIYFCQIITSNNIFNQKFIVQH